MRRIVAAVGLSVLLSGCASVVDGSVVPAADLGKAPTIVKTDQLKDLLVSASEANSLLGTSDLAVTSSRSGLTDEDNDLDVDECVPAVMAGNTAAYAGTGYVAAQREIVRENVDTWKHQLIEAVVGYQTAEEAEKFLTDSQAKWSDCEERVMSFSKDGKVTSTWTTEKVQNADGVMSLYRVQEGAGGWGCEQALTAKGNVVIEARLCGRGITGRGIDVVKKSAEKVAEL